MTHLKRQKLISSTQVRGYNTQFLLYPRPRILFLPNFRHRRVILHWPTIFRQNRTTLCGVLTSHRFFKMAAGSHIGY